MTLLDLLVPPNECVQFYGRASSGKTSFALYLANDYSRNNTPVVYIDAKGDLDPEQAKYICPNIHIAHTTTSFSNVTQIMSEVGAKVAILDDLTQFYIRTGHIRKLLSAVQSKGNRIILLNQVREKPGDGIVYPYFHDKISPAVAYNLEFLRRESTDHGNIYGIRCKENREYLEILISNSGILDEYYTYRQFAFRCLNELGLTDEFRGASVAKQRQLFAKYRDDFINIFYNKYLYIPKKEEWI